MKIIFLGTAGSIPTKKRALPSIAIIRNGELILFDCGEGVQRQISIAKINFFKKVKIFITHMHGDHVLGVPGILQTRSLYKIKEEVKIFGPKGIKKFIDGITSTIKFNLTFEVEVKEIEEGIAYEEKKYTIHSVFSDHIIPNLAYALIERDRTGRFFPEKARNLGIQEGPLWSRLQNNNSIKLQNGRLITPEMVIGRKRRGIKVVYSGDTRPCEAIKKISKNADLLIYEATFDDELSEKAYESGHSTSSQGAKIAYEAKVKKLFLTHIGARYKDDTIILDQAKSIFSNVIIAEDFMSIEIPHPD